MDQTAIKQAFRMNAAFSGLSGALGVALHGALGRAFGAPTWLFPALGLGLVGFAIQLVVLARRDEVTRKDAISIIASDALWVIACVDLVLFGFVSGALPVALALGSCLPVTLFTILQVRATFGAGAIRSP